MLLKVRKYSTGAAFFHDTSKQVHNSSDRVQRPSDCRCYPAVNDRHMVHLPGLTTSSRSTFLTSMSRAKPVPKQSLAMDAFGLQAPSVLEEAHLHISLFADQQKEIFQQTVSHFCEASLEIFRVNAQALILAWENLVTYIVHNLGLINSKARSLGIETGLLSDPPQTGQELVTYHSDSITQSSISSALAIGSTTEVKGWEGQDAFEVVPEVCTAHMYRQSPQHQLSGEPSLHSVYSQCTESRTSTSYQGLVGNPLLRCLTLFALLFTLSLPRIWRSYSIEKARQRELNELMQLNATGLKKQKKRMQDILSVESHKLEQSDILSDGDYLDMQQVEAAPPSGQGRNGRLDGSTNRQWSDFVAASKVQQVSDVWSMKEAGADTHHRATKAQLEAMTARFRTAAEKAPMKKEYVSFEQLCMGEKDYDSGLADRVAKRKARFQGQFLNDEDVGLKAAPKKPVSASLHGNYGNLRSGVSGSGRDYLRPDASQGMEEGRMNDGEDSQLAARRKQLGLGEGRRGGRMEPMTGKGWDVSSQSSHFDTPALLEIKPKRRAHMEPASHASGLHGHPVGALNHPVGGTTSQPNSHQGSSSKAIYPPASNDYLTSPEEGSMAASSWSPEEGSMAASSWSPEEGRMAASSLSPEEGSMAASSLSPEEGSMAASSWSPAEPVARPSQRSQVKLGESLPGGQPAPVRMLLSRDEAFSELDLQQSLRLRSHVNYLHPSVLAGSKPSDTSPDTNGTSLDRTDKASSSQSNIMTSGDKDGLPAAHTKGYIQSQKAGMFKQPQTVVTSDLRSLATRGTGAAQAPLQTSEKCLGAQLQDATAKCSASVEENPRNSDGSRFDSSEAQGPPLHPASSTLPTVSIGALRAASRTKNEAELHRLASLQERPSQISTSVPLEVESPPVFASTPDGPQDVKNDSTLSRYLRRPLPKT
ncbi:hypothetical protein CEUSTIGMA_g13777.t1 [Chlamydomonas eustigma]|uniref:Uncharacterized protein n=1 Tax=Chlamydomonas eustigma TaxID=1157962 RepID=A0A250XTH9_9CHLO|nr:hypothetical protein CEUSTIGMA_g13777.t1 [Chlamydomonas eustigma]|eukprot:GAX86365.1 hypothetical protein CEUSTIGMA_g13777.t1 [Chlamydomonas eustigma]